MGMLLWPCSLFTLRTTRLDRPVVGIVDFVAELDGVLAVIDF
jgi:hypothetical protein